MDRYNPFDTAIAALPVITVVGFFLLLIVRSILAGRQRELELKGRIAAIENNVAMEPSPAVITQRSGNNMLASGVIFICTGLGLGLALAFEGSGDDAIWGVMPVSAGVGLIVAALLNKSPQQIPTQHTTGTISERNN